MSSKTPSDAVPKIEWRIPTTDADLRALRRIRQAIGPRTLADLNRLASSPLFPTARRRRTFAGAEPFRL